VKLHVFKLLFYIKYVVFRIRLQVQPGHLAEHEDHDNGVPADPHPATEVPRERLLCSRNSMGAARLEKSI